jgi:predicted phage baseplate assembly protein
MTLAARLDNTDFKRLVDVALRKIPTASHGNWTLHAPVDPGIALVELFAWLLEQRSYWVDQVTAPLVSRAMALFDDEIRGARPAGVAMTFEPELAVPVVPSVEIARRTALRVPETELVFALTGGLTALALARYPTSQSALVGAPVIELAGVAGFGAEDLRTGRPIPLLAATGASEARIGVTLREPPPASATLPLSILFELDTAVLPEWHPDAVAVPPPADVRWEFQDTGGAWWPLPELLDGTGGLRRSGLVRFALPRRWSAYGPSRVGWLRAIARDATFASPPTVLRIAPNSALARHAVWTTARPAVRWLPLPGRTIQLEPQPLPIADRVAVFIAEPGGTTRWRAVPDLVRAGPADRVFTVDRVRARLVFGDGLTGRVPRLDPAAEQPVTVCYAAGAGTAGNLGPCAWDMVAAQGGLAGARSFVSAVGGRDPETLDDARARAAAALRNPERAVTARDHEVIACATPGVEVARAHAEVGLLRGECGVVPGVTTVFVVPGASSRTRDDVRDGRAVVAPAPDPGMLDVVRAHLEAARLVGEVIRVEPARYRRLRVRVTVAGAPRDRDAVRQRLAGALRLYVDPLLGGDDHAGWPFGQPVRQTALLRVAQRELGDRGDVTEIAIALDGGPLEACREAVLRSHELIAVDRVDAVIHASAGQGGLR